MEVEMSKERNRTKSNQLIVYFITDYQLFLILFKIEVSESIFTIKKNSGRAS